MILKEPGQETHHKEEQQQSANAQSPALRKFTAAVQPGQSEYKLRHNLETEDVIVQTRIAGKIREGGISIIDANVVQLIFGGVLNETIDVVIIG